MIETARVAIDLVRTAPKQPAIPGASLETFEVGNGRRLPGVARRRESWIELVVPLPDPVNPELPWRLLQQNSRIRGGARFARHDETRMGIMADAPIDDSAAPPRFTAALDSIREAVLIHHGSEPSPSPDPEAPVPGPDWSPLAAEQGWSIAPREDGRLAVELDASGVMSQAFIEPIGGGALVSLALLRTESLPPVCRRAIAWFLLSLTARLHLVRAAVQDGETGSLRLEVVLPLPAAPAARWLDLGLEALSLGARIASREVRALSRESLARTYLAHTLKE